MQVRGLLAALVVCPILFFSCNKKDDNSSPVVDTGVPPKSTWRITLFSEHGENNTGNFSNYTFTFNNDGTAVATKSGVAKNGTWSFSNSNTRFNINFGEKSDANKPLGELTDDWVIVSVVSNRITLKDDNDNSMEQLVFTSN